MLILYVSTHQITYQFRLCIRKIVGFLMKRNQYFPLGKRTVNCPLIEKREEIRYFSISYEFSMSLSDRTNFSLVILH